MEGMVIFKLQKDTTGFKLIDGKTVEIEQKILKDGYYLCEYRISNNNYNSNVVSTFVYAYLTNSPNKCRSFIHVIQHSDKFNLELSYNQTDMRNNVPELDPVDKLSSPFISKVNEYMYSEYAEIYGSESGFDHLLFLLRHGGIEPDSFIKAFDYFELDLPLSFEKSVEYPLVFKNLKESYKNITYNVAGVKDKTMARLADSFIHNLLIKFDELYPYQRRAGLNALSRAEIVLEHEQEF